MYLRKIAAKCTSFDPEKRYSDISLVERALKRRFPFAAVTALFAAVLVTAGVLLLSQEKEPQEQAFTDTATFETENDPIVDVTAEPVISQEKTAGITTAMNMCSMTTLRFTEAGCCAVRQE